MKPNQSILTQFLTSLTFLLVFFLLSRTPIDADLWWHLRAGQAMWERQAILLQDIFSYTKAGAPWVNAFWLSELLLYRGQSFGGYFALGLFVALSGAVTFHMAQRRMNGNPIINSFVVVLAAAAAAPVWGPRPQALSFLLVALLDFLLTCPKRFHKWLLIPIFALWANLHGGWIWGFLLLTAQITGLFFKSFFVSAAEGSKLRRESAELLGWTALAATAVGINPNGIDIWKLPFAQVNVSLQIQEWLSPDFHRVDFHPMLWMLFLLLLAAPFAPKPLDLPQIFKTIGFAYLTFIAQRNIALFALTAAPLLSDWMNAALQALQPIKTRLASPPLKPKFASIANALILLLAALVALGNLFTLTQKQRVEANYPTAAVAWLRTNHPPGRLFNSYNWGGYLIWALPEYPVFIDGRADLYGNDLMGQWQDVVAARENAPSILEAWRVEIVLLEPHWEITDALQEQGWNLAFQDEQSVILLKQRP